MIPNFIFIIILAERPDGLEDHKAIGHNARMEVL